MDIPWSRFNLIWQGVRKNTKFWNTNDVPEVIENYEDFRCIPKLKKTDLMSSIDDFICSKVQVVGAITTGGSTGEPLKLPIDKRHSQRCREQQALGRARYGVGYRDRCFLIWGHSAGMGGGVKAAWQRFSRKLKDRFIGYYRLSAYSLGRDVLRSEFGQFIRFKPKWVCGYSSAVVAFARANWDQRDRLRDLDINLILCSAEMLHSDEVKELEEFFGAPVALEYGAMEFGPVAYTRPDAPGMFVMDDLLVEAIPTGAEHIYRLYVTSLYSRVVPLIRYDLGDEVKIYDPNFCGGVIERFDEVLGRNNDIINFADGTAAHSEVVTHAIKSENEIFSFQFHKWEDAMQLMLVAAPSADEQSLMQRVRTSLVSVNANFSKLEVAFVEDVDVTTSGKRRWIVEHTGRRQIEQA